MKLPRKLKIGAHSYTVREVECTDNRFGDEEKMKNEIRINRNLPRTQKIATLIHEIMGAQNQALHSEQHALMEATAEQLTQVLVDNNLIKL